MEEHKKETKVTPSPDKEGRRKAEYEAANARAERNLVLLKSGIIKMIAGVLLLAIGILGIIGLVEVIKNNSLGGMIYFGISVPLEIIIGTGLIIWYNLVNVRGKTAEKAQEKFDEIHKAEAKDAYKAAKKKERKEEKREDKMK
jgi:hypothetical protein